MNRIKLWPHATILAVVVALAAGLGVWFYAKHEQTVTAAALPNAARIQRVDGDVALSNSTNSTADTTNANAEWRAATANQPFSVGDRIYTRENSHASLAFNGRNFARLDPNTSCDVVSFGDRRTQLALRSGSAMFDVGYLEPNELFEVATPNGAVDFDQPGLYNVGFNNNGGVLVSVLSGLASVVGSGGSSQINKGEMLTLLGEAAAQASLSRLNRQDAGYQVDNYYRYQYPNSYDGRYNNYDAYLSDPNYYDPYRRNASYQYASSYIPGLNDLDAYGDWQNVSGYGYAWRPRVDQSWVPYQQGYWSNNYGYGPTWVSSETWGYAPYHYGRWASVGNQWYWIPDGVNTTPQYAPALVAFLSFGDGNQIGWVPLGPGDSYAPRYYDNNWQPQYLTQNVAPAQFFNLANPGSVTVVPIDAFGRTIDPRSVRRVDQQTLASARPTLDPLTVTPLRNAVLNSAWGRGKIDLPPGIAKKLNDTRVVVSANPGQSFRPDLAKSMRVETVPETSRSQKLNLKDERNGEVAQQPDAARKQQVDAQAGEAARGNKDAGRPARAVGEAQTASVPKQQKAQEQAQRKAAPQQQQQAAPRAQRQVASQAQRKAAPQQQQQAAPRAQGVRVGHPAKAAAAPQPARQRAQPQAPAKAAAAPQPVRQEAKPKAAGAAKQESKPAAAPAAGGKGQDKKKHP
jgi:FecR protein